MNNVWVQLEPEGGDLLYETDDELNRGNDLNPYNELSSCLRTMSSDRNMESTKNLLDVVAKAMTNHMSKQSQYQTSSWCHRN